MDGCVRIPPKSATDSGRSRPPIPAQAGRVKSGWYYCRRLTVPMSTLVLSVGRIVGVSFVFTHRVACEVESIAVVHEAIQDGVGQGGFI